MHVSPDLLQYSEPTPQCQEKAMPPLPADEVQIYSMPLPALEVHTYRSIWYACCSWMRCGMQVVTSLAEVCRA